MSDICAVFHDTGAPQLPAKTHLFLLKMLQTSWKRGPINMHQMHSYVYTSAILFNVSAEKWNSKCVNNCLMRALHRGQSVTASENRAAENSWLIFPTSQITTVRLVIRHPLWPRSAGAFFLPFICGSVFHTLKILKLDQVQIYDRQEEERDVFSPKRTGQTPPPPATSARLSGTQ